MQTSSVSTGVQRMSRSECRESDAECAPFLDPFIEESRVSRAFGRDHGFAAVDGMVPLSAMAPRLMEMRRAALEADGGEF